MSLELKPLSLDELRGRFTRAPLSQLLKMLEPLDEVMSADNELFVLFVVVALFEVFELLLVAVPAGMITELLLRVTFDTAIELFTGFVVEGGGA